MPSVVVDTLVVVVVIASLVLCCLRRDHLLEGIAVIMEMAPLDEGTPIEVVEVDTRNIRVFRFLTVLKMCNVERQNNKKQNVQ